MNRLADWWQTASTALRDALVGLAVALVVDLALLVSWWRLGQTAEGLLARDVALTFCTCLTIGAVALLVQVVAEER